MGAILDLRWEVLMTVTEFLHSHVPLLAGLSIEEAHCLARIAGQRLYRAGQTIVFQATTEDSLGIVATGAAALWLRVTRSRPPAKIADLQPGDVFGETSIVEFGLSATTVKAAADDTLVLSLPEPTFLRLLETRPEIARRIDELMAARTIAQARGRASVPMLAGLAAA